jgi:hypothetical protein
MKNREIISTALVVVLVISGWVGCQRSRLESSRPSSFVDQAVKPVDLVMLEYRMVKAGAVGESVGFELIWIPLSARPRVPQC